jgi:3-oxoacyl-[acyl-carrier protein] reductase
VETLAKIPDSKICFTYTQNESQAMTVANTATKLGAEVRPLRLNLLDKKSIEECVELSLQFSSRYDVVVHNAGVCSDTPLFFMEEQAWNDVVQLSLNSFFYLNKAFLPGMMENRWGRIIALASVSGEAGQRGQCNYAAAKGAVISATKSLAKEVARKGILANIVSPGLIETDMTSTLEIPYLKELVPLGRMGKAQEVANVVKFLASEEASYICGSVLQVNGGMYT